MKQIIVTDNAAGTNVLVYEIRVHAFDAHRFTPQWKECLSALFKSG